MIFHVIKSNPKKLSAQIEGNSFKEVCDEIASIFGLPTSQIKAFCEIGENRVLRYSIYSGEKLIVELVPKFD